MFTNTYTSNDIFKLYVTCNDNAKYQHVKSFPYLTNNSIFWYICQSLLEATHHSIISSNIKPNSFIEVSIHETCLYTSLSYKHAHKNLITCSYAKVICSLRFMPNCLERHFLCKEVNWGLPTQHF